MTRRATLIEPQRKELAYAAANHFGLTHCAIPINGLGAAAKRRMMDRLCAIGLFREYVHGGWEITPAGRAALAQGDGETGSKS